MVKVTSGPLLADRTTLRLGGPALAEIVVQGHADLDELAGVLREVTARLGGVPVVLGAGSNILAADSNLELVLIRSAVGGDPVVLEPSPDCKSLRIRVPAAMRLPRLLGWCCGKGLHGLEQLTGIPGSLGGAVAMNAGSYGLEMADIVERVLIWTPQRGGTWLEASELRFGYRHFSSRLDDPVQMVLAAELNIAPNEPEVIRSGMRRWYDQKKLSQPITMASAGCVFKNPSSENSAGSLLEQVGLRGYRRGNMAFSERHANFLVNLGRGTAQDALALLEMGRERVAKRFGLVLETEVRIFA